MTYDKNHPAAQAILRLVAENDGKYGWYSIDRRLSSIPNLETTSFAGIARLLKQQGYFKTLDDSSHAKFYITEKGRAALKVSE